MAGIGREAAVFLYACLSGCFLFLVYRLLYWFRKLFLHKQWMISLEDLVYWIALSGYLFYQIYRTTYGEIRWYFMVGVFLGCIVSYKGIRFVKKIKQKCKKHLEKHKETR